MGIPDAALLWREIPLFATPIPYWQYVTSIGYDGVQPLSRTVLNLKIVDYHYVTKVWSLVLLPIARRVSFHLAYVR